MRKVLSLLAVAATLMAGAANSPVSAQSEPYYDGKRLNLLVPFGPGGGTDVWARFIAKYLQSSIEGSPTVLVDNRPGGGSISGVNHFTTSVKPDGYTALVTSGSSIQPYLLRDPAVRYNLKDFIPLAANPVGAVFYVSPTTGITSIEDLQKTDKELFYGGISATGNDLVMLMIFDLLGMDVKSVMGYGGKGPIRVAYERGEVNVDYQVTPAFLTNVQPLVDAKQAIPLFTFGIIGPQGDVIRDPAFPNLPTVKEVYQKLHGKAPSGLKWDAYKTFLAAGFGVQKILWVKQGTPEKAVDALTAALADIAKDPKFFEEGAEIIGPYPLFVGQEAVKAARGITEVDDEVLKHAHDFLKQQGY